MRLREAYKGSVDIAFKECNPGMAFVSRLDIFVAFQIIKCSDFSIYPCRDVLCR